MKITDLSGKNICILGFGKEGRAMLQALDQRVPDCEVTIADKNDQITIGGGKHWLQVGTGWLQNLEKFDVIIKSPGIPHQPEFDAVKEKMTSSTQIFLDSIKDSGALVIGVTGSKGKSTTSTLIYEILRAGGKNVSLIGNIGEPAISHIDEAFKDYHGERSRTIFVLEMSSAQLMDLTVSPHIAVVTSFFPEHLDYHHTIEAYMEAKKHIARFQTKDDTVFYNNASDGAREIASESRGTQIPFSAKECPVAMEETLLIGEHNRSNIAAAYGVGMHLQIPRDVIVSAIKTFRGLPHRLQSLGVHHGLEWIDDAISTTPESTIAALDALGDRVRTVILGGQDRGNDFAELAQRIKNSSVETVILFPGSGPRIRSALESVGVNARIQDAPTMNDAVAIARKEPRQLANDQPSIVLLSTASPSYNMFKNFEEKGALFETCIKQ